MKFQVTVIAGSRKTLCVQDGEGIKVYVTKPPLEGRANVAVIDCLATHFKVKKSAVEILKGLKSRHKIVSIDGV